MRVNQLRFLFSCVSTSPEKFDYSKIFVLRMCIYQRIDQVLVHAFIKLFIKGGCKIFVRLGAYEIRILLTSWGRLLKKMYIDLTVRFL